MARWRYRDWAFKGCLTVKADRARDKRELCTSCHRPILSNLSALPDPLLKAVNGVESGSLITEQNIAMQAAFLSCQRGDAFLSFWRFDSWILWRSLFSQVLPCLWRFLEATVGSLWLSLTCKMHLPDSKMIPFRDTWVFLNQVEMHRSWRLISLRLASIMPSPRWLI